MKEPLNELERRSCSLNVAIAIAHFHSLLLAYGGSSITSHNATITVLVD